MMVVVLTITNKSNISSNKSQRGQGLMIDIQAIKIGTTNEGDYANNSSTSLWVL